MSLPKFTRAFLNLTDACNLRCRYCFVKQQNNFMSYQTAKDAADFLLDNAEESGNKCDITFFGGEPLLLWDKVVKPLIAYIRNERKSNCTLSITTNGTLLTEEILQYMKANKVGILFSIDGHKAIQDYNRPTATGVSSYDLLEKNISLILKYFPNTTFRSTIIPDTCEQTWESIQFAIKRGYKTLFTTPNVFEVWSEEKRSILAKQIHQYSEYYVECFRKGTTPIKFTTLETAMKRVKDINSAARSGDYRAKRYCTAYGKCGLGSGAGCSIAPNGDIYTCQEMPSNYGKDSIFHVGSIYTGVDDSKRQALVDSYDPAKARGGDCQKCKYNRICDGGCPANNFMINEDIHINAEAYCWWRQIVLKEAEWIIKTLGEERNEYFRNYWMVINRD